MCRTLHELASAALSTCFALLTEVFFLFGWCQAWFLFVLVLRVHSSAFVHSVCCPRDALWSLVGCGVMLLLCLVPLLSLGFRALGLVLYLGASESDLWRYALPGPNKYTSRTSTVGFLFTRISAVLPLLRRLLARCLLAN